MDTYPEARIVSSTKAFVMMKNFFGTDFADKQVVVGEGSTLELGRHTLTFVTPCTSGIIEILQQGTVVYAETVTAQTMLLPSALQGIYELQLTWCGVTYKAEITL